MTLLLERLDPSEPLEPHGPLPIWTLSCTSSRGSIQTFGSHDQDPHQQAARQMHASQDVRKVR